MDLGGSVFCEFLLREPLLLAAVEPRECEGWVAPSRKLETPSAKSQRNRESDGQRWAVSTNGSRVPRLTEEMQEGYGDRGCCNEYATRRHPQSADRLFSMQWSGRASFQA